MRLVMMHKNDTILSSRPNLMHELGAFVGAHAQAGRFVAGAGLRGSRDRARITFRDGESTVQHGPYSGQNELPASALLLCVRTREEAMGWAERYGKILGSGEIELGAVCEPWDFGFAPEPADAPLRLLLVEKANEATEKEGGRPSSQKAELARLRAQMSEAGVLSTSVVLQPSAKGKRLTFENHRLITTDGPFAESKELLGGFSVMELSGFDEAIELCKPYAAILGGTVEIDLRPIDASAP